MIARSFRKLLRSFFTSWGSTAQNRWKRYVAFNVKPKNAAAIRRACQPRIRRIQPPSSIAIVSTSGAFGICFVQR